MCKLINFHLHESRRDLLSSMERKRIYGQLYVFRIFSDTPIYLSVLHFLSSISVMASDLQYSSNTGTLEKLP